MLMKLKNLLTIQNTCSNIAKQTKIVKHIIVDYKIQYHFLNLYINEILLTVFKKCLICFMIIVIMVVLDD